MQHEGHMMGPGDEGAWRMPPMGDMPMLPGLETAMPPVDPWLAGMGMDPEMFPEARPNEIIDADDGEELELEAALVRREINKRSKITIDVSFPAAAMARRGLGVALIDPFTVMFFRRIPGSRYAPSWMVRCSRLSWSSPTG